MISNRKRTNLPHVSLVPKNGHTGTWDGMSTFVEKLACLPHVLHHESRITHKTQQLFNDLGLFFNPKCRFQVSSYRSVHTNMEELTWKWTFQNLKMSFSGEFLHGRVPKHRRTHLKINISRHQNSIFRWVPTRSGTQHGRTHLKMNISSTLKRPNVKKCPVFDIWFDSKVPPHTSLPKMAPNDHFRTTFPMGSGRLPFWISGWILNPNLAELGRAWPNLTELGRAWPSSIQARPAKLN